MDLRTIRYMVKEYLGIESFVIVHWPLLTRTAQEMRKKRCQKLLNKLKGCKPNQFRFFSNEKTFTGDVVINLCYLTDLPVGNVGQESASLPSPTLL
jgi:hypothetical protein